MSIFYLVLAALALGILVFFHELGHYYIAKRTGMVVEIFSIGFGKPLLKWRWNDVDWQLGWLPFGGYVKIKGMEFGKKEKESYDEPYQIPNGFFSKSPIKRMMVACAGPFANFILAFLLFLSIWVMGGREKTFSEFTRIIGWVDPQSELYELGVRPGDILTEYNGKPYTSSKDLLYAAMLGGKEIELKGLHVNHTSGEKTPFSYKIHSYPAPGSLNGILTTGITAGARYLIYDHLPNGAANPLTEGSPMASSGISYQDRIVWADGEYVYSMDQLSYIINHGGTLLTIKRGKDIFLTRQPRILASDLALQKYLRDELSDWQYERKLEGRWQDLFVLPYVINNEGYVERPAEFIDKESRLEAFPLNPYSKELTLPLQAGDKILAVDGIKVQKGYQILEILQSHKVQLIVEKKVPVDTKISWLEEDKLFEEAIRYKEIDALATSIGTNNQLQSSGRFALLNPVEPKRLGQFALSEEARKKIEEDYKKQLEEIDQLRDKEKRRQALNYLESAHKKRLLGIALQDRKVDYNPTPWALFGSVFTETGQTLKALVMGYLHPKWISGPIGIVQVIHQGWKTGVGEALFWIGAISLNLGMLNMLPIPVLDGGYICLSLWELITRRRLKAKTMERLVVPFAILLIGMLVFFTFQDISRFFSQIF